MPKFKAGDTITNYDLTIFQTITRVRKNDYQFDDPERRTRWYMPINLVDKYWKLATNEEAELMNDED